MESDLPSDQRDVRKREQPGCSSRLSTVTESSIEAPLTFSNKERNPQYTVTATFNTKNMEPASSICPSLKSGRSRSPPPDFSLEHEEDRKVIPGLMSKTPQCDPRLPSMIEDWTKEQVRDWLTIQLRVPQNIAQNLYDQELSGACLVCFEKQDLLDLGVPPAPALQIIRQVERYLDASRVRKSAELQVLSGNVSDTVETETVSSDSGIQSLSSTVEMLQIARHRIKSALEQIQDNTQVDTDIRGKSTFVQLKNPNCQLRPFNQRNSNIFYKESDILPPVAGPSDLIEPVHEYQLLPTAIEASEKEIIYEFTKEVYSFAASCMNSRTNGTIHFGVNQLEQGHGEVVGHQITSFSKYNQAFQSGLSEYFEEKHINAARLCIRPPIFIQVHAQDGTTTDKWVMEVDVVPTYQETKQNMFYTLLSIESNEKKQQCKTECLFVREGLRSVNILVDTNPRKTQEKLKNLADEVQSWASARKTAEEKGLSQNQPYEGNHGQRLKQLVTRGRDAFENTLQVVVVTDKCPPSEVEHLDFLNEIKLFAALEFDPESDLNGTCSFYRRDRVANLHYPYMYTTQDSAAAVIGKLNLFKQTSWIFCNGRVNEEAETDKPLTPSEWLKKRSGDITNMISLLFKPDLLSKDSLLVVFILHSAVTDISNPILETFCAIHRTLEGVDNMLCICKNTGIFSDWKALIESRCKEDITNKCIYELSLNEISSTIKNLKKPQTQSSRRFLPSAGSSSVLLTKKDEELMTVLDILCENECQNTEIETKDTFLEFKKKTEEDFYRGGQVSWWNFYLSEMKDSLPFIKRDKYNELYDLITPVQGYTYHCVMINLFHHPGCGGTTLAMHVLWNLRRKFRCAVVKNKMATNNEIAAQVTKLLTLGREDQPGYTPVLLLVDNWNDVEDLKQCIVISNKQRHKSLMVIILNCERSQHPAEMSRTSRNANVVLTNKLSAQEQNSFSVKLQQLKSFHEKPETFYAFMIMTNNFSEAYISNLVSNIVKDFDISSQQGQLFSFLTLLNTFVNGSYISLSLCEELVGIRNALLKHETLEDRMNPCSTLMITFTVEEHGTYQAVRFLHQMIAEKCLEYLTQKYRTTLSEMTINVLFCDKLYKSYMGKDFLLQNIQSMLITRQRKEQGDDKTTSFSPLIEKIAKEEGHEKVREVLERATCRFEKSATMPQALARHFCLQEKDFDSAIKWALDAQGKKSNSYMADTVGQVHKSHLKKIIENSTYPTPEELEVCLSLGTKAVNAFQESQELAKTDQLEQVDQYDLHFKKRSKHTYNTSGHVGEIEVMMTLLDFIQSLPLFPVGDRHKRDQLLQFLRGHRPLSKLYDPGNATFNVFLDVLANYEALLTSLKRRLKDNFSFFESYFQYLKPRSQEREATDDRNKRKLSEYFKKYIKIFSSTEMEKGSEKASKPQLSLLQQIEDQRCYLEFKRADSFAGLLQYLTDKSGTEMEHILKKWQFIFENSPYNSKDIVNFLLANIILHCIKPCSILVKKYEWMVDLLNEELQKVGTNSKLTELYYLSMLLMWPTQDKSLESFTAYPNIGLYVSSAKKSFHHRFSHMFPARSAIAHFFLGKSKGLQRIVSKVNLDKILCSCTKSRNLHFLWQSGEAWNEPEFQKKLLRVKGKSENGEIYVNYGGKLKLQVRPVYLGDIRSGHSRENVSFYLGFTLEGPVAYNIKYENDP